MTRYRNVEWLRVRCRVAKALANFDLFVANFGIAPSIRRQVTSGERFVTPQAMRSLWPTTIPGAPGNVAPATCIPGDESSVKYQILGAEAGMCGSLASSGLPETVRLPETTQLLLA